MRKTSFARWPCSVARTLDLLGDAWTPLVLREAFYGLKRFDEFQTGLGIARNTLAGRLRRLVDEGLLEKHLYQTEPRRYESYSPRRAATSSACSRRYRAGEIAGWPARKGRR